jgi:selenide,water dikinase
VTAGRLRLILLGGGHAHLHVLQAFAKRPLAAGSCVLVSPHGVSSYSGMVPGVVAGHYEPAECTIPLASLAAAAGVRHVAELAVGIDAEARHIRLADGRSLPYELLSLDTGGQQDARDLPGAADHALFVRPLDTFMRQLGDRLAAARPGGPGWVVIGGGAAGFELAMALRHRGLQVSLVTGGAAPLAGAARGLVRRAGRALSCAGVVVLQAHALAVGPSAVEIDGGRHLNCEGCLIATGTRAPPWLAGSGLALDAQGFVATGPTLQSVSHPTVLAVGDVASRVDVQRPRSGVQAVRAGPPLARNLRLLLAGLQPRPYAPPRWTLNILSCGDRCALVSYGRWSAEGRWAWRWKDRIDRGFVAHHGGPASDAGLIRAA